VTGMWMEAASADFNVLYFTFPEKVLAEAET
jgi:hypothetical protein